MNRIDEACDFDTDVAAPSSSGWSGFLGIDPGKEGYLALLSADEKQLEHYPIPLLADGSYDLPGLFDLVRRLAPRILAAMLEEQAAIPETSSPGDALTIGFGLGLIAMALVAAGVKYEMETPSNWKTEMGIAVPRAKSGTRPKPPAEYSHLGRNELRRAAGTLRRRVKDEKYAPLPYEQALLDFLRSSGDRSKKRRDEAKGKSDTLAAQLFPRYDFRRTVKCKNTHDGMTESALLAVFGRRRFFGARV